MSALSAKTNPRDFLRLYFVVGILTALWGYAFSTCLEADGLKFKLSVALGTSACLAGFIIKMSKLGAKTQQLLLSFVCIANCCVFAYMVWIVMKLPMHPPVAVAQKKECQKDTVMTPRECNHCVNFAQIMEAAIEHVQAEPSYRKLWALCALTFIVALGQATATVASCQAGGPETETLVAKEDALVAKEDATEEAEPGGGAAV